MAKNLVIVESPAKCKTISKYLGKNFSVKASMGHIIDLPVKEIGIDFEHDFTPKYIVSAGKKKVVQSLIKEAKKAETVYLASDPDREGEAIAWHVADAISKVNTNVKRVMFNEITKKAVLAAIEKPLELDMNKVNAQQTRRILDRIVGYQISPVLWKTIYRGLSAGRVQSVALRLICEREDLIRAFKQEEYWSVTALLAKDASQFHAKLLQIDGEKINLTTKEATAEVVERIRNKPFVISDIVKNEKSRNPYAPFITSTLQQDAARKLYNSAAKTMMVAQQLYEGLELGDLGTLGLITYMRTDSTRISDEALRNVRECIKNGYGEKYLPASPRLYGKSKSAQDAHEAIRPSQISMEFAPEKVKQFLSDDQFKMYDLIWKRFFASQMANAIFDATRIDVNVENCLFRANGLIMKFDGFLTLYDETVEESNDSDSEDGKLPELSVKQKLDCKELVDMQHFTQPPPRYSEASLVKELEEKGIGRPSTYAQIIDTLKKRNYVEMQARRFFPTEIGFLVKKILISQFPLVFDVGFTAEMENSLDRIEAAENDWIKVLHNFYGPFSDRLKQVTVDIKELKAQNQETTDRTCPLCNEHKLIIKWSRNGRFFACQGFPACKHTEPLDKIDPVPTDEKCDKCGAPMHILTIGPKRFMGCSKYPECKNTKAITTGIPCPKGCSGMLVEKKTRFNKNFYGCNKYPECTFATWDMPINIKCDACNFPLLVHKITKTKGEYYMCPQCKAQSPIPVTQPDPVAV